MNPIMHRDDPKIYPHHNFTKEPFVRVRSDDRIDVHMMYPLLGMKHAETDCIMRRDVYRRLQAAAEHLPDGYRLRVWDAWRPFLLQQELYELYSAKIIQDFHLEAEENVEQTIQKFVSVPIADIEVPPVHTTGGAVDVTIIDQDGNELLMGCEFDAFTDATKTDYFEREGSIFPREENPSNRERIEQIRDNRRLLYYVMTDAGFTNLPSEWWHYDFGDRFYAYYTDEPAVYEGVFDRESIYGIDQ